MIKSSSDTKSNLTCEECGEPIKHNQIDNKPIYCEFCGALNSSVYAQNQEKSQLEQNIMRFSYITEELSQEIRNLTYQKIYELLKANFSIMTLLKHQEDLKQSQIFKLAKKLRKLLLSLSLPSDSAELLTKTSKKKIENYFEKFHSGLKKKKKNQSNYMPYFIQNIKFVFRLINGDYEVSNLTKYNQKAVKKLKEKYGFKINAKTKNSFSYSLSILICRKIYRIITAPGYILDLKHSKNELTKQYTLNTAKDITALVLNYDFKRNFSKPYRSLRKDLEIDWVYRESFIDHVCSLIKLIYKLTYSKGYSSKLRGFQKLIAEELKVSALFENDTNYSPYLRLNLTLILSRIIHYVLESSLNLTPLQSDPRKLNPTDNLRLASEILDEILGEKKIKPEFLKKFYNLSLEEFQKEYEKLQAKLKSDMLYRENFLSFLQNLINTIYKITHTRTKKSNHLKIELAIIQDLANYNFNWELLKKEKSCFYSEEKEIDNRKNIDDLVELIAYNRILNQISKEHKGENIYESLIEISRAVLESKFNLIKQGIEDYLNIHNDVKKRRRYIIYLFECKLQKFKDLPYIGYTHSKSRRFINHIMNTIVQFNKRGNIKKMPYFRQAILLALRLEFDLIKKYVLTSGFRYIKNKQLNDFKDLEIKLREIKSKNYNVYASILMRVYYTIILNYFTQRDLARVDDLKTTLELEHEFTTHYVHFVNGKEVIGTVYPNGLNMVPGGGGSGLKTLIYDVPLFDLVALVSLGFNIPEISDLLTRAYKKLYTEDIIQNRLSDIWGGLMILQDIIFRPVVEGLIKDVNDYNTVEISLAVRRSIVALLDNLKDWYKGAQFNDLKRLVKLNKLDWSRIGEYLNELRSELRGYTINDWVLWIIDESITLTDIASKCGYSYSYMSNHFKKISHLFVEKSRLTYKETKRLLRKKIAKENLILGMRPEIILLEKFNYKSVLRENGEVRWDMVEEICERIFKDEGLSYEEIEDRYFQNNNKY